MKSLMIPGACFLLAVSVIVDDGSSTRYEWGKGQINCFGILCVSAYESELDGYHMLDKRSQTDECAIKGSLLPGGNDICDVRVLNDVDDGYHLN